MCKSAVSTVSGKAALIRPKLLRTPCNSLSQDAPAGPAGQHTAFIAISIGKNLAMTFMFLSDVRAHCSFEANATNLLDDVRCGPPGIHQLEIWRGTCLGYQCKLMQDLS